MPSDETSIMEGMIEREFLQDLLARRRVERIDPGPHEVLAEARDRTIAAHIVRQPALR